MQLPQDKKYTYADYIKWDDGQRYELIDGVPYMMSPAPSPSHQKVSVEIVRQLANYLVGKVCDVFSAPFDVRLNANAEDNTVVQPDISIICDPKKIDERGCKGAPDMVVEILSPSTLRHDQIVKFRKYQEAGVREYWLVNPEIRGVQVFLLENGKYVSMAYERKDTIPVSILEHCAVDLGSVFPQEETETE
jgi:Uma2 family endonuclease